MKGDTDNLQGKVALVTGGTAGLGLAAALTLARRGVSISLCGRSSDKGAQALAQIEALGAQALFVVADVLEYTDMERLVADTVARFGQIDMLVASGGGSRYPDTADPRKAIAYFEQIVPTDVTDLIAEAALAKLNPARAVVDQMIARGSGSITFITSEGGRVPTPTQTAIAFYAGGLIAMTRVMAKELSRHRIRVNCVAVSVVEDTPSFAFLLGDNPEQAKVYDRLRAKAPFGLAKPDDIAEVVAFLASDAARFVTGATVSPTGGLTFS